MAELAEILTGTDLAGRNTRLGRIQPVIGEDASGMLHKLKQVHTMLVTGSSGGGNSTVVTAPLEQMLDSGLQFCVRRT